MYSMTGAEIVIRLLERQGIDKIESFIDTCLSVDNLIDPYSAYVNRKSSRDRRKDRERAEEAAAEGPPEAVEVPRLRAKSYMDIAGANCSEGRVCRIWVLAPVGMRQCVVDVANNAATVTVTAPALSIRAERPV